jgi:hypothetical protein
MMPTIPITPPHERSRSMSRYRSAGLLWLLALTATARAEQYQLTFDDPRTSWNWRTEATDGRLLRQERSRSAGRESSGELIEYAARRNEGVVRLEHALPPCRVLDELEAAVWLRASRPGWELSLRIVTPGITWPDSGEPAAFLVRGEVLKEPDRWQALRCRTSDREINNQLRLLRAQIPRAGDPGEMFVDRVVLQCRATEAAASLLMIDELELGPLVPVSNENPPEQAAADMTIPTVEFQLDRIHVGGRPIFPRIICDHGEPVATLAESGCNLVWVTDVTQSARLKDLQNNRLWAIATPPRPRSEGGELLTAKSAGLMPFSAATDPVLCWMMGIRLGSGQRESIVDWIEQVRAADRRRNRPVAVEVVEDERLYSRDVQLLGMSRHPLGTTISLPDYRDWLAEHRALASPGAFCWTWIQCEPSPSTLEATSSWASPPQIEPEQIRLQVYAALSAGCRGLGFWTTQPLNGNDPATRERYLALQQVNLELELLSPWLATMGGVNRIPCQAATGRSEAVTNDVPGLSATVIRTDFGTLVLPTYLDRHSQFVPAQAAFHNVSCVVPGVEESAAAYEITTTRISSLGRSRHERVPGGRQITLPRFDQTAIIWLTSDFSLVKTMEQRIAAIQRSSAAISLELARRKLDRVGQVDARLQEIGARLEDGPQLVGKAKLLVEHAQAEHQAGNYHQSRLNAEESMQSLRILQRLHWSDAVRQFASPVSSPYTLCFQTLPDHWRLVELVGNSKSREPKNLLPSGNFENGDTLVAEGWEHAQSGQEGVRATAEVYPGGRKRGYALRLSSQPLSVRDLSPAFVQPVVTVTSPPIPVRAGQIVHVTGWVKQAKPISGSSDGFQISESILGRTGSLRYRDATDWTRFELLREAVATDDWRFTLSLTGLGEASIDDVLVTTLDPLPESQAPVEEPRIQPASNSVLDRLPRLPGLSPRKK